nr:ubiquitin carboxyl-terminal hydrolase 6 [Arachis hypogaea]
MKLHAYRDGRLEEVVLRHLGAVDGYPLDNIKHFSDKELRMTSDNYHPSNKTGGRDFGIEWKSFLLRDEEGKNLGLKGSEKSSVQKDNNEKMADAEGSSNGGGEPSVAPMEEGEKVTHMTGIYDLVAVLTHKGRSADSGHYVGWVKQEHGV